MITRRRPLLFGLLTTVLVLGTVAWLLWPTGSVTDENYRRLRRGMTLQDACMILGPPSDYIPPGEFRDGASRIWEGDGFQIVLEFDRDERIQQGMKQFPDTPTPGTVRVEWGLPEPEGHLDRLRRWLRV
jgi:hypothetical protein